MNTRLPRAFATKLLVASLVVLGAGGGLGFAIVDLRHDISVSANNSRVIEQRIVAFLVEHVAKAQYPWSNRRARLP